MLHGCITIFRFLDYKSDYRLLKFSLNKRNFFKFSNLDGKANKNKTTTDVNLSIQNCQVQNLKIKTNQNTRNENWCHAVDEK